MAFDESTRLAELRLDARRKRLQVSAKIWPPLSGDGISRWIGPSVLERSRRWLSFPVVVHTSATMVPSGACNLASPPPLSSLASKGPSRGKNRQPENSNSGVD